MLSKIVKKKVNKLIVTYVYKVLIFKIYYDYRRIWYMSPTSYCSLKNQKFVIELVNICMTAFTIFLI